MAYHNPISKLYRLIENLYRIFASIFQRATATKKLDILIVHQDIQKKKKKTFPKKINYIK